MAVFNPQVPATQAPDYTGLSRPVSDYKADTSAGQRLSILGEGIVGAAKLGDDVTKMAIKDDVRKGVEGYQNDTTTVYEQVRAQLQAGAIPNAQTLAQRGIAGDDTLTQDPSTVPGGLQAGISQIQALGTAQSQNGGRGKANDTLYTGAINSLSKQLRNQYPGYKDYVDEQVKSVSGIDPANAYMRNLLEDINRGMAGVQGAKNKVLQQGYSNMDIEGMPAYIKAVEMGLPGAEDNLMNVVNRNLSNKNKFDVWKREREVNQANKTDNTETNTEQYRSEVSASGYELFSQVVTIPGLTQPATIQKLIQDQQAGKITLTDEQNNQLLSTAVLAQQNYEKKALAIYNSNGYAASIKDPKLRQSIVDDEGLVYKQMVDSIKNKEYGTLFFNERAVAAKQSTSAKQFLDDPDMGKWGLLMNNANKFGGQAWTNQFASEFMRNNGATNVQNFLKSEAMKAQIPDDLRNDGSVKSLYGAITAAKKANIPVSSKVYDNLVENVNVIGNDKAPPQVKAEVVKYTFDPANNANLLKLFGNDFTDDQGVYHAGKFAVYDTVTKPKVVDNIWNLKDRDSWDKFKDWNEMSFKTLFGEEVQKLDAIGKNSSLDVKVKYDSDHKQFMLEAPKVQSTVDQRYLDDANVRIKQLNKGLGNLAYVKDKEGTDTNAYLFDVMLGLGYSPNDRLHGNNLPQKIIEAIHNSKKSGGNRIEDAFRAAN